MFKEFKKFVSRGNVIDLAVGVMIGGAFGKIVSSLVDDILMPIIGAILGGLDFTNLSVTMGDSILKYGNFVQNVINFLFIALTLFIIIKIFNKAMHKKEEPPAPKPEKSADVKLLEEIRDLLKKSNKK